MSTKGRKPLSNAEKDLKGTLQNCRINNDAPKSAVTSEPKPVSKLDTLGKKVWSRTVKFLKDNKMMDDMDVDMLSIYCIEMSNYFNHLKMARQIEADNAKAIKELVEMQVDPLSKVDAISKLPRPDRWVRMADSALKKP